MEYVIFIKFLHQHSGALEIESGCNTSGQFNTHLSNLIQILVRCVFILFSAQNRGPCWRAAPGFQEAVRISECARTSRVNRRPWSAEKSADIRRDVNCKQVCWNPRTPQRFQRASRSNTLFKLQTTRIASHPLVRALVVTINNTSVQRMTWLRLSTLFHFNLGCIYIHQQYPGTWSLGLNPERCNFMFYDFILLVFFQTLMYYRLLSEHLKIKI